MALDRCRVVLVRPEIAANIGSTARVMRNFGLRDLVLVAPVADPSDAEARRLSTHGEEILSAARIVPDLDAAIGDCYFAAATSARTGGLIRDAESATPGAVFPRLVAALGHGPAALVFGPEPSGLTSREVSRCQALIHIAADPEYPALNLAQSVAICLYELRNTWARQTGGETAGAAPAAIAEREVMYAHLRASLEQIHFLYGEKADTLMHALRRLIDRAAPSSMEVKLLHGLARQLEWFANRCHSERSVSGVRNLAGPVCGPPDSSLRSE